MNFKKHISYLFDILLEETSSDLNPVLKLYLSQGQLKLVTKNAVYSYGNRYYNFRDTFTHLNIGKKNIKEVLILGLGMGSIMQMLEDKFQLNPKYDIVELDPVVVRLFEKYINGFIKSECSMHIADAFEFMKHNQKQYDLVCMDIFCDDVVPDVFETNGFLVLVKNALNPNGLFIYNRLNIHSNDKEKNEALFQKMNVVFQHTGSLSLEFNRMLIASENIS